MKEGFDDLDMIKEHVNPLELANYEYTKTPGFSASLPLLPSRLPFNKAVVVIKLNNLKTSYGVRISWTGVNF